MKKTEITKMKNEIQVFNNPEFGEVRTILKGEEIWFVGKDVARILGYIDTTNAIKQHCKGVVNHHPLRTAGGIQEIRIINESDVMRMVVNSKLPEAQKFEKWVFEDVLPSIRKHGTYMTNEVLEKALVSPEFLIQLANQIKKEREEKSKIQEELTQAIPKVQYFDKLVDRECTLNFRDTSKELNIPQNTFITKLLEDKFIYRDKNGRLKPYAKYINDKNPYFTMKEFINTSHSDTQTLKL